MRAPKEKEALGILQKGSALNIHAHSNLVFLHFPRLSDLSLFFTSADDRQSPSCMKPRTRFGTSAISRKCQRSLSRRMAILPRPSSRSLRKTLTLRIPTGPKRLLTPEPLNCFRHRVGLKKMHLDLQIPKGLR